MPLEHHRREVPVARTREEARRCHRLDVRRASRSGDTAHLVNDGRTRRIADGAATRHVGRGRTPSSLTTHRVPDCVRTRCGVRAHADGSGSTTRGSVGAASFQLRLRIRLGLAETDSGRLAHWHRRASRRTRRRPSCRRGGRRGRRVVIKSLSALAGGDELQTDMSSVSAIERRARRAEVGIRARLFSIADDARWLRETVGGLGRELPIFGNLRSGSWYVSPDLAARAGAGAGAGACYFKSTDGHAFGPMSFSLTRLNLSLASTAARAGGAVVVDATSSGAKRFPDSFNTIAVWCAVLNAVVLPGRSGVPPLASFFPTWQPPSIAALAMDVVARTVAELHPDLVAAIRAELSHMTRPLVPAYVCQPPSSLRGAEVASGGAWEDSLWPLLDGDSDDTLPVICVNVSRIVDEGGDVRSSTAGFRYVSGAGDDAEHWAQRVGLTPELFWAHADKFTETATESECLEVAQALSALAPNCAVRDIIRRDAAERSPSFWSALTRSAVRVGESPIYVATADAWDVAVRSAHAASEAEVALPSFIFFVRASGGAGPEYSVSAFASGGLSVVEITAPTAKRSLSDSRQGWQTIILPAFTAVLTCDRIVVAFEVAQSAAVAATVSAAAILGRSASRVDKTAVRTALALSCAVCKAPTVERSLFKELTTYFSKT